MERIARETLPAGHESSNGRTSRTSSSVSGNAGALAFALGVVFVFIFLAALYESLTLPLAVILIVPMCLLAAILGVNLRGPRQQHPHADRHGGADRPRGEERHPDRRVRAPGRGARAHAAVDAAIAAAHTRLRPILMTSAAFIFGVIPLAFGSGPGAELRQALGVAVFFGMIGVTAVRAGVHAGVLRGHAASWPDCFSRAPRVPRVRIAELT